MKTIFILVLFHFFILNSYSCEPTSKSYKQNIFETKIDLYKSNESKYIVLIIPPTGGINFIDSSYAKRFCLTGINSAIIKYWSNDDEYSIDLEIHTRFYNRAQRAIDIVITNFPHFEFGILGTSVGGLHASIAASRRSEILKTFLIVSGGNIAEIISNTSQDILVDAKKKRFKKYKFNELKEYTLALSNILPFEPLNLKYPKSKKFGMIISTNDTVVPTKNQIELKKYWKPNFYKTSWLGHVPTVVKTWLFDQAEIINFFNK